MDKKESNLYEKHGILEQKIIGKTYSKVTKTTFEGSSKGVANWAKSHNSNHTSFRDSVENTKQHCLNFITEYLETTRLSSINSRYKGTSYFLSDAFFIEDEKICYFTLSDTNKDYDLLNKYDTSNKYWHVEALKRYRSNIPQPEDIISLSRNKISEGQLTGLLNLEKDSVPALAGKMIWFIQGMFDESRELDFRLMDAVIFGETLQLFNVYAQDSVKQSKIAKRPRKEPLNNIIKVLKKRKQNGESPKELWDSFVGLLDQDTENFDHVQERRLNPRNVKSWSVSFLDLNKGEDELPQTINYGSFARRL